MHGWYHTPGWGALATVTVAVIALIVSAAFNAATLCRAAKQFRQLRRDAMTDKLRTELAGFLTDLEECLLRSRKLGGRLSKLSESAVRDTDDAVEYRLRAQEAYVETVADIYMQLGVRGFTLMMLTTDKAILNPAQKIQALIDEDRHDFGVLVRANESKRPNELVSERGATMLERHESRRSDLGDHIEELTKYCVTTFPIRDDKSKPVAGQ